MIEEAIKIIVSKCSSEVVRDALATRKAFAMNSPVAQLRYNNLLEQVFASHAVFTAEEKEILAEPIATFESGDLRSVSLTIRLTPAEKDMLLNEADQHSLSISEYSRRKLLGKEIK